MWWGYLLAMIPAARPAPRNAPPTRRFGAGAHTGGGAGASIRTYLPRTSRTMWKYPGSFSRRPQVSSPTRRHFPGSASTSRGTTSR